MMSDEQLPQVEPQILSAFFEAIEKGDADTVRSLLSDCKALSRCRMRSSNWKYEKDVELDAYKFLGAYLGALSGLQLALIKGYDRIALDIIDATLSAEDLEVTCGGGNTALHLSTFLGARDTVRRLLERGCRADVKNAKGFKPMDVVDDAEIRDLYASYV